MLYRLFIFLFAVSVNASGLHAAVGPPSLRGITVKDTLGDVILTWQPPSDPLNEFFSYHVYYSASPSGPFFDIATVTPINQNTYTHTGASAAASSKYYYIRTFYGPGGSQQSQPSDTLRSMLLNVGAPTISTANLTWNNIHSPSLSTSLKFYIFRDPNMLLLDSTTTPGHIDTLFRLCDTTRIFYYVVLKDSYGCSSVSAPGKNVFRDLQPPPLTSIEKVAVDINTNRPYIVWYPNKAKDLQGYYIFIDPNVVNIATVAKSVSSYTDVSKDASTSVFSYRVAAFDSCTTANGIPQLGPYENAHSTIHLTSALNICTARINLSWTKYVNWRAGVSRYEIYQSIDGGPYSLLTQTDNGTTSYTVSGLVNNSRYKFHIVAWDGGSTISSTSNSTKEIRYTSTSVPGYLSLTSTQTDLNRQKTVIYWNSDPAALLSGFKILRSRDSISFDTISFVQQQQGTTHSFVDEQSDPQNTVYYYRIVAVDSCKNIVKTSNAANTMVSRSFVAEDFKNSINWNSFDKWTGELLIYRNAGNNGWEPFPLASLSSGANIYIDTALTQYISSNGVFCYYIDALNPDGTRRGTSNITCLRQIPKIYVPNTFIPGSQIESNRIFKPVNVFINSHDYRLIIYNRWGKKVFQSYDPNEGWDGTANGELQPTGVYAYDLRFFLSDGTLFEKTGSLTLLR